MSALTAADVRREQLAALGREPFTLQLDEWLREWSEALRQPDAPKNLRDWMLRHPDRAAQAQAIFARLAGYTEKLEIRSDRYAALDALSDAELEQELSRRLGLEPVQLRALAARPVLEVNAVSEPADGNSVQPDRADNALTRHVTENA